MVSREDEDEELGELMQLLGASAEALRGVEGGEGTAGDGGAGADAGVGYRAAGVAGGARQGGAVDRGLPGGEEGEVPGGVGGGGSGRERAGLPMVELRAQQQQQQQLDEGAGLQFGDFGWGLDEAAGRVPVPVPVPVPVTVAAHADGQGGAGTAAVGGVGMAAARVGRVGLAAVRAFGELLMRSQQGPAATTPTAPGPALHWGEASPGGGGGGRWSGAGGGGGSDAVDEGTPGRGFTPRRPSDGDVYGGPYEFDPQYGTEGAARLEWVGTGGRGWGPGGVLGNASQLLRRWVLILMLVPVPCQYLTK